MARTSTFLLAGIGLFTMAFAQSDRPTEPNTLPAPSSTPYRSISHNAFKPGEKLTYGFTLDEESIPTYTGRSYAADVSKAVTAIVDIVQDGQTVTVSITGQ